MWRHGDVFITTIDVIPGDVVRRPGWVLVEGEATGHSHRLDRSGAADRLERGETLYLRVLAERATVIDSEHRSMTLPRGLYQVWKPRESSQLAARTDAKRDAENFKTRRSMRRIRGPYVSVVGGRNRL